VVLHFKGTLENPGIETVQSPEQGCGPKTEDSGKEPMGSSLWVLAWASPCTGKAFFLTQKIPLQSPLPGPFLLHTFLLN